jgi:hypothetical protein
MDIFYGKLKLTGEGKGKNVTKRVKKHIRCWK